MSHKKKTNSQPPDVKSYPVAFVVYDVAQKEYEAELGRSSKVDNKIGITLAFLGAFSLYVVKFFNVKEVCELEKVSVYAINICVFIQICIVLTYILTITLLLLTAKATKYLHFDCNYFVDDSQRFRGENVSNLQTKVAFRYIGATIENTETNDKRAKLYNRGALALGILLVLCILAELLRINCLGLGV